MKHQTMFTSLNMNIKMRILSDELLNEYTYVCIILDIIYCVPVVYVKFQKYLMFYSWI